MLVYLVWEKSISGWSQRILTIVDSKEKAERYIKELSGGTQYQYSIEIRDVY